jgi:hypothetical protein
MDFCMNRLRPLKSFQIFKVKIKNQKPIAVEVLFKAYPIEPPVSMLPVANLLGGN